MKNDSMRLDTLDDVVVAFAVTLFGKATDLGISISEVNGWFDTELNKSSCVDSVYSKHPALETAIKEYLHPMLRWLVVRSMQINVKSDDQECLVDDVCESLFHYLRFQRLLDLKWLVEDAQPCVSQSTYDERHEYEN